MLSTVSVNEQSFEVLQTSIATDQHSNRAAMCVQVVSGKNLNSACVDSCYGDGWNVLSFGAFHKP